jgi:hypothetical protein
VNRDMHKLLSEYESEEEKAWAHYAFWDEVEFALYCYHYGPCDRCKETEDV